MSGAEPVAAEHRRLDQWLWFARFVRSRSLAVRLLAAGAVTRNGAVVKKANQAVRIGDCLTVPQGRLRRTVRVLALGARRGPFPEAHLLYQEIAAPVPTTAEWVPLLADEDGERDALG